MTVKILKQYNSQNFDNRSKNTKIKYIILHYTETDNLIQAVNILSDKIRKVSSHYVIDQDGMIYQLVDDSLRAWHAGLSYWKKDINLNDNSIGIEIVNKGEQSKNKFSDLQIEKLIALLQFLINKYQISKYNILGHSDVAPTRKIDPGIFFPWKQLFSFSIGLPIYSNYRKINLRPLDELTLQKFFNNLDYIGYSQIEIKKNLNKKNLSIVNAFHRHFYPILLNKDPNYTSFEISEKLKQDIRKKV